MSTVAPFHYQGENIYHYRDDCERGKSSKPRLYGKDGLKPCAYCGIMKSEERINNDKRRQPTGQEE